MERLGAAGQVRAASARPRERDALWSAFCNGDIDIIGSDHSPCPARDEVGEISSKSGAGSPACSRPCRLARNTQRLSLPAHRCSSLRATRRTRFRLTSKGGIDAGLRCRPCAGRSQRRTRRARTPASSATAQPVRRAIAFAAPCAQRIRRGEIIYHGRRITAARRAASSARKELECNTSDTLAAATSADHLLHTPDTFVRAPLPGMRMPRPSCTRRPAIGADSPVHCRT